MSGVIHNLIDNAEDRLANRVARMVADPTNKCLWLEGLRLAAECRFWQKTYHKTKSKEALIQAKQAERLLDLQLSEIGLDAEELMG